VVGLPWSKNPEGYAGGRFSYAGQVKGDDPDKKGYPGPPRGGLGEGLTTSPRKPVRVAKPEKKQEDTARTRKRRRRSRSSRRRSTRTREQEEAVFITTTTKEYKRNYIKLY
jgi:hypothetical protein